MLEVSERALEEIKRFLEGRAEPRAVRILLDADGGWRGPHLILALDTAKEDDQVFTDGGVTFLVEKKLFDRTKPVSIDYILNAMGGGYMLKSGLLEPGDATCEGIAQTCYPHG